MKTKLELLSNPRMHNPDGIYASEARGEDYYSLRDYFAGKAMNGYLSASVDVINRGFPIDAHNIANECYIIADAMIKARSENEI